MVRGGAVAAADDQAGDRPTRKRKRKQVPDGTGPASSDAGAEGVDRAAGEPEATQATGPDKTTSKSKSKSKKKPAVRGSKRWHKEQAERAAEAARAAHEAAVKKAGEFEYEATEEELEEERQDAAVRLIQGLFRARKARQTIRALVRANYVKEYDRERDVFVYRNKKTGELSSNKPKSLGSEDLPDPSKHQAPADYVVRKSTVRQYAYVVHVMSFGTPKIQPLSETLRNDHEDLEETLCHPFLCKFDAQDCIFSKNPTLDAFRHNFDTIRRKAQEPDAVFLFYLSTQCVTVQHDIHQGAFFMLADSQYRGASLISRTALALSELAGLLKSVQCAQKIVVLDVSHNPRPEQVWLRTKFVYPPRSIYRTIADKAECVVIGSCRLGPLMDSHDEVQGVEGDEAASGPSTPPDGGGAAAADVDAAAAQSEAPELEPEPGPGWELEPRSPSDAPPNACDAASDGVTATPAASVPNGAASSAHLNPRKRKGRTGLFRRVGKTAAVAPAPVPEAEATPVVGSTGGGGCGGGGAPTAARPPRQKLQWSLPGRQERIARRNERKRLKALKAATFETASYAERNSVFGHFFLQGLAGLAADSKRSRVTARQLFVYLRQAVVSEMQTRFAWMHKGQTPQLLIGTKNIGLDRRTTACTTPSVLPPPKPPFCENEGVLHSSLRLKWLNPAFTGAQPLKYEIQVRGVAKYNSEWERTGAFAEISQNEFHVTHLVTGLKVQFRVRAFNYGGWSEFSEPGEFYTPSSAPTLTVQETMRSASNNGLRSVIGAMKKYATNSDAVMLGCWIICKEACSNGGFKRCSIGKEIVEVVLPAMQTFPQNTRLQQYACLALGWACYGHAGAAEHALELGADKVLEKALKNCPMDAAVHGNSSWARANIMPTADDPSQVHGKLDDERRLTAVAFELARGRAASKAPPPLPDWTAS